MELPRQLRANKGDIFKVQFPAFPVLQAYA